tara:strand:- start:556 stop:2085 length:1530 start_codon:yes stop_codon:yes gene_type:complete
MKFITIFISVLSLLAVSSAYADYDGMKDTLNAYTPPGSFLSPDGADTESPAAPVEDLGIRHETIESITSNKSHLAEKLAAIHLDRIDEAVHKRISAIISDTDALKKMLSKRIRLEDLKAVALLRNPGIHAARKKVYAELQTFDQVMNLDDSLRQYSAFTESVNNKVGPVKGKDSIKMSFPSPGLTGLKGRVIENQVAVLIEKAAITGKNVLKDIETVYWTLVFIDQSIKITHETITAFERLRNVATALYRSGKTSFQDVIKINIKIEELKEDLTTLASRKETDSIQMLELMDMPHFRMGAIEVISPPGKLPQVSALYDQARRNRQELNELRYQIAKVSSMVEMAESMIEARPDLGFSLSEADFITTTGSDAAKDSFPAKTMAAMKNNSPVRAWYGVNEPWLLQTRQTLESLKSALQAQENATDRMVRSAWFKADKNKREHALYKNRILPLAKSALDVTTKEYEAGSIPFSQAIDSYTYWLKVKLTIARKRSDYGTAFTDLETITGKQLR